MQKVESVVLAIIVLSTNVAIEELVSFRLQISKHVDSWNRLVSMGLLEECLVDELWHDAKHQKRVLLGLMDKCDLLCKRRHRVSVRDMLLSYRTGT